MSEWTRDVQQKSVRGGDLISVRRNDPEPEALTNLRNNLFSNLSQGLAAFNNDNWQKAQNITNQALDTQSSLLGQLGGSNGLIAQNQNLANQLANIAQTGSIPSTISNALNDSVNKGLQSSMGTMLNNLGKRGILNSSVTTSGMNQLSQAAADAYNRNYLTAYQTVLSGLGSSLQAGQNNVASLLSALGAAGSAPSNAYTGVGAGLTAPYNGWKDWQNFYQNDDPYETIYNQKAEDSGWSCITGDTLVTLEDGREIPVAELKDNDKIRIWDFVNGCMASAPMTAFFKETPSDGLDVVRVEFEDGSNVGVIVEHLFFDLTEGKFIAINSDSQEYVGHEFAKVNKDGKVTPVKVSRIFKDGKATETYAPHTGELNYLAGGFISGNDGQLAWCNRFEFDTESMTYDKDKRVADLVKYGRLEYEELREILSEDMFHANHLDELSVSIGKGLMSVEQLKAYLSKFTHCFLM